MKRKVLAIILATLITATEMTGCGSSATTAGSDTVKETTEESDNATTETGNEGDTIKIGYVGALSGDTALWGQAGLDGAQMTVDEINEAGGVLGKQLELIGLDGKGAADDSVAAYKQLVDQYGVVAVIGTNFSSCNIPIAEVSDDLHIPVVATAASNELVTVAEDGSLHPYSFRLCFIDSYMGTIIGTYAAKELGAKTAALITDASDTYSTVVGQYMADSFEAAGGTVVASEQAQSGDNDFRAQLTKIAAQKPDVLFVPWIYEDVCLIAQQTRELGIDATLLGADGWDSGELINLSEGALENCYYVSRIGWNSEEAAQFGERYAERYHIDGALETESLYGHDGVTWIVSAIEKAGSADPDAIRDQLEATESFDGLLGHMSIDPSNHNPSRDAAIFKVGAEDVEYLGVYTVD